MSIGSKILLLNIVIPDTYTLQYSPRVCVANGMSLFMASAFLATCSATFLSLHSSRPNE